MACSTIALQQSYDSQETPALTILFMYSPVVIAQSLFITTIMGSLLMEKIFQSAPNEVLMAHTEWLPGVQLRHFRTTCEEYDGWCFSSCS